MTLKSFRTAFLDEYASRERSIVSWLRQHWTVFTRPTPILVHPLKGKGSRLSWRFDRPLGRTIRWVEGLEFPGFEFLDLHSALSTQFTMLCGDDETHLWVQGHHAAFDGGAAAKALLVWMQAYDNLCAGRDVSRGIQKSDKSQLPKRNRLGLLTREYLKHLYLQPIGLFGATKFMFRRFGLITNSIFQRSDPVLLHDTFPTVVSRWVSDETLPKLKRQAKQLGTSLNSVLMAHLFLTVWKWRTRHQFGLPEDWLRILLPMSIRGMSDRRLPGCNRSTIVQIDRRPVDFEHPTGLAQGIDYEVGLIHRWQLSKLFLILVRVMSAVPFWLKASATDNKYRGTMIFTNLGDVFGRSRQLNREEGLIAGNLKMIDFDLVGPVRRGMGVNLSSQQHCDRLRISVHVDPRQVDKEMAEELMNEFVSHLETKTLN